jgi:4'-phosphopantetheinyl transferase
VKDLSNKDDCLINILYTFPERRLTENEWEKKICCLPKQTKTRVMRYKRWQDRQAKMYGYLLLAEGLGNYGYSLKGDVHKDQFGRPYVSHGIDFNISDSEGCVVCAITSHGRIGIDIEKIRPIDFADFTKCMSPFQWKQIEESENIYTSFYDFWTIKESTLKADGRGLSYPLDGVEVLGKKVMLDGKLWFLTKLNIRSDFSCHLACDSQENQLEIKEIHY